MKKRNATLCLRAITPGDADAYARLMTVLGYPTNPDAARRRIETIASDPHYRTVVAEVNGEVRGLVGVRLGRVYEMDDAMAQVLVVIVDEGMQGKGVGTALLGWAEAWAKEQGTARIALVSGNHRVSAHQFYERRGYEGAQRAFRKRL